MIKIIFYSFTVYLYCLTSFSQVITAGGGVPDSGSGGGSTGGSVIDEISDHDIAKYFNLREHEKKIVKIMNENQITLLGATKKELKNVIDVAVYIQLEISNKKLNKINQNDCDSCEAKNFSDFLNKLVPEAARIEIKGLINDPELKNYLRFRYNLTEDEILKFLKSFDELHLIESKNNIIENNMSSG